MKSSDLERTLTPALSRDGFKLDEVQAEVTYGDRAAWVIFYRRPDCKLQICWSARDGGTDFMLAPLDAPNEFGLDNRSKKWQFMLMLDGAKDDIKTPGPNAGAPEIMEWLELLYQVHFEAARVALLELEEGV